MKETAILSPIDQLMSAGLPKAPVERVAGAMFLAATDTDPDTNGAVYCLPDEREVFLIPYIDLQDGLYKLLKKRVDRVIE